MTRPHDPTSPRWDLRPEPLPVDLDAITTRVLFDQDGWQIAELFGLVTTVTPHRRYL